MKITDLHIYGFGQLEDVFIEKLADVQVFFGENEAGKSTIMAFIHAILFGFPTKQSAELRYEPKHGAKYGGRLRLDNTQHGFASVERIKGKSAIGDVTVTLETGQSGGEELLSEILSGVDKGIFQAIFSFNLHGLQNVHQMKGEEIGRFLFSAGTLGTDRLASAELELQKELDVRFKLNGKKPILNEKLLELHRLNDELKKAAAKNESYETLVEEKEAIQKDIAAFQAKANSIRIRMDKLHEWKKVEALVKEEKWLVEELTNLGHLTFPAKGVERYEKLDQLIKPYDAQISSLTVRIDQLQKELEKLEPDRGFLENEAEVQSVMDRFPLYSQFILQEKQAEIKLSELEGKIAENKEQLYAVLSDEEILSVNTNIYIKDQVQDLSKKGVLLEKSKQELEARFSEEKQSLEDIEEAVCAAKEQILTDTERMELEKQATVGLDRYSAETNLKHVQEKIAFYKAANEREKRQKQQRTYQQLVLGVLLVVLAFYGWAIHQLFLTGLGGFLFIIIAILLVKGQTQSQPDEAGGQLKALLQEERKWRDFLESPQSTKTAEMKEKLIADQHRREQLQLLLVKLEQQQRLYDKVIDQFEHWGHQEAEYNQEILKISKELKIPTELAKSHLLEAFQRIGQLKGLIREKRQLEAQIESLRKNTDTIKAQLQNISMHYAFGESEDMQKIAYYLRSKLAEEQEKAIQYKEKCDKLADLEEDRLQLTQEKKHLQSSIAQLLAEAEIDTETAFFEKGERAERKMKLEERLVDVEQQTRYCLLSELERNSYLHILNCDEIIREHRKEADDLQSRLTRLSEQLAAKRHEIQMVEEGGIYSEILHRFKLKQEELKEEAKDWAVYRFAQDILLQTVEKYKNTHLPRLLTKAEGYLSFLTEGHYCKILLHPSKAGFLIEREDHTMFEANELSQATTEQVYVAIRLALATTLYERFEFPIIIDDSFVNFDAKRTKKVMELLRQLKHNQILFFTCHQHLLDYFSKNSILYLHKGAVQGV